MIRITLKIELLMVSDEERSAVLGNRNNNSGFCTAYDTRRVTYRQLNKTSRNLTNVLFTGNGLCNMNLNLIIRQDTNAVYVGVRNVNENVSDLVRYRASDLQN